MNAPFDPQRRHRHYYEPRRQTGRGRKGRKNYRRRSSYSFGERLAWGGFALFLTTLLSVNSDAQNMALRVLGFLARDNSDVQAQVDYYGGGYARGSLSAAPTANGADTLQASFGLCHSGGGTNCVVDGDTFWFRGDKIRIADIDTPETHPPRCDDEAQRGRAATMRLQALLNAGAFSLEPIDRDSDVYGRQLRVVTRGGQSLGGVLVNEGLARWYAGGRQPWC